MARGGEFGARPPGGGGSLPAPTMVTCDPWAVPAGTTSPWDPTVKMGGAGGTPPVSQCHN